MKQNPWVLRDQELRRAAAADRAPLEQPASLVEEEKSTEESNGEELEYGPGYVKKIRERFLALAKGSEDPAISVSSTPRASKDDGLAPVTKRSSADNGRARAERAKISEAQVTTADEQSREAHKPRVPDVEHATIESRTMVAVVLEQVEKIGQEIHRKTSVTMTDHPAEDLLETFSVRSIKERFEPGSSVKGRTDQDIASESRRDRSTIHSLPSLLLAMERSGLDETYVADEFPVAEGKPSICYTRCRICLRLYFQAYQTLLQLRIRPQRRSWTSIPAYIRPVGRRAILELPRRRLIRLLEAKCLGMASIWTRQFVHLHYPRRPQFGRLTFGSRNPEESRLRLDVPRKRTRRTAVLCSK